MSSDIVEKIKPLKIDVSIDYIFDRLQDRFRWPLEYPYIRCPSVEFIQQDGNKFNSQELFPEGYLDSNKALHLFHSGYTMLLSNIGTLHPSIRKLYQILSEHYQKHTHINMYIGTGKSSVSFLPHQHEYDVIVKNVCGESKWIIGNKEETLKDNEVLFIPKFTEHCVYEIREYKCSLTCNIL